MGTRDTSDQNGTDRRAVLKAAGSLTALGSMVATTGCLGGGEGDPGSGGGGPDLDGELSIVGQADPENIVTSTELSTTDAGYELTVTVTNDAETTVSVQVRVIWQDGNNEEVTDTESEMKDLDVGNETTLTTTVEDPNKDIVAYSATIQADNVIPG